MVPAQTAPTSVDTKGFRSAMARLAATVSVVTTLDAFERPWGFTATSVCSLSLDPPLILVCLDRRARSHRAFCAADRFAVSMLKSSQERLAERFASAGADKFAGDHIIDLRDGLPVIRGALVQLECAAYDLLDGGDHTIVVGRVERVSLSHGRPLVYLDRGFHPLAAPDPGRRHRVRATASRPIAGGHAMLCRSLDKPR